MRQGPRARRERYQSLPMRTVPVVVEPGASIHVSPDMQKILALVIAGTANHHVDIAERIKTSRKNTGRHIEKLAEYGALKLIPQRDPFRIYRAEPTAIGIMLHDVCKKIRQHRKRKTK